MMKTLSTLTIYACLYISFFLTITHTTTFDIHNNCPYTVWAAAVPGGSHRLDRGQAWTINVPSGTTGGRIWARTNCNFDNNGRGRCQTGDCGGVFQCTGDGQPPHTRAEYALNLARNLDFFYISLVDGFNVPMEFRSKTGSCHVIRCTADIIGECPNNLRVPGGCTNPCTVRDCGPTQLTRFFKERCPDAYSYPRDDQTSRFTCPVGNNYRVVFCP